jgi:hypothetical protein
MSKFNPPGHRPPRLEHAQIKQDVLLGVMNGTPLAVVARRNGTSQQSVDRWASADPEFAEQLAAARSLGWDHLANECLDIADDSRNDYVEQFTDQGEFQGWRFNSENVNRSKLRIETRLRLLARWDSGRYGDNKTVKLEGEVTSTTRHVIDPRSLDDAGRAALRHLIEQAKAQGLIPAPEPTEAEWEEAEDEPDTQ